MKTILATTILVVLFYSQAFAGGYCYNFNTGEEWGTCEYHTDCQGDPPEWFIWCAGIPDVDDDGIADYLDPDTLYGYISGLTKVGVSITIARVIDAVATDEEGYYAFGGLEVGEYLFVPTDNESWFLPRFEIVTVE
jgi:hypothetical protein